MNAVGSLQTILQSRAFISLILALAVGGCTLFGILPVLAHNAAAQTLARPEVTIAQGSVFAQPGSSFAQSGPILAQQQLIGQVTPGPLADPRGASTTILPTDVVPLPDTEDRQTFGENLQLRILQRLPAKSYFNVTCESSFRLETNPFQFPPKRAVLANANFLSLGTAGKLQALESLRFVNAENQVFRVLPNVTVGWALTPHTRVLGNYFMISDTLFKSHQLNTVIQSVGGGIQHDFPIGRRGNLQAEFQFRELFQRNQIPVFDFLPAITYSHLVKPNLVAFTSTLLQLRGKRPFQAPNREIDPFYTFGGLYRKGPWTLTATATFVQNFREPFRGNALIPVNSYSWICDFEIARRIFRQVPGLQAFLRAEPIFNFHSSATPGLSGNDFRLFYGIRIQAGKPPLTAALRQIREQLEEQEATPPPPRSQSNPSGPAQPVQSPSSQPKQPPPGQSQPQNRSPSSQPAPNRQKQNPSAPSSTLPLTPPAVSSAQLMPYQLAADSPQPMHGTIDESGAVAKIKQRNRPMVVEITESNKPARPI